MVAQADVSHGKLQKLAESALTRGLQLFRSFTASVQPQLSTPPPWLRKLLTLLFAPIFSLLFGTLFLYCRLFGPLHLRVSDDQAAVPNIQLPDLVQLYIYLFGCWEPDISAFVRKRLSLGGVFCDVGAHVGYYTLLSSKALNDSGSYLAIEASPSIYEQLKTNLHHARATNGRALNVAVTVQGGTISVFRGPDWNRGLTTTRQGAFEAEVSNVKAMALDQIMTAEELQRLRLIKIDVEGTERELLPGLLSVLKAAPAHVEAIVELSPRWWSDDATIEDVLEPFSRAGFHVYHVANNYLPWRYLWSRAVTPPQRYKLPLSVKPGQIDIVLSRIDADELS